MMKIIAIETSHDDTSVVLYENKKIVADFSYSQTIFHKKFGGTVPEYAARVHFENLCKILPELKKQNLKNLDHIAYTDQPGLVGSLHMGRIFAKALAFALKVEAKAINHLYAHIFAVAFNCELRYPALALVVSGGHTQIWHVKSVQDIVLVGQTKDDAVGEVYDKVARFLNLGFPGGPVIDKRAQLGENVIDFSLKNEKDFNFSFSGIKTKVKNYIHNAKQKQTSINVDDLCCSFQKAIIDNLIFKMTYAIKKYQPQAIILGGGVAANSQLRARFKTLHEHALIPELAYTTDNAKMIAIRSAFKEGR